ncbi:hypothetical protein XELAEV_18040705mg [Xenopus laevis]|uniref:Ig-like domain-containing protein n=1 Tax=Xenopus laevis TaxID=8355 RepID=A0A974CB61_XENLA|nr:hypothetical protein XELAEV_18040705mg [Xenopus laevis]
MSVGAVVRPVISFSPNWSPIFTGESVTLTCNVAPTAQGNLEYSWYRDEYWIPGNQQRLVIGSGIKSDSGDYQCQTGVNKISYPVRLDIKSLRLILQAPPVVHEGDSLSLRCHSWTGYYTTTPVFYKDNEIIESPVSESELHIGRVDVTASGTYKCKKEFYFDNPYTIGYRTYTDEKYILVSELFTAPQIKVSPDQVTKRDHMTITCDTKLSPHRETTELQFVFYRNGHNVQGFSLSNQYGVPSAQLEDSGNYTCEVQTPTGSVRMRSSVVHNHIQELFTLPQVKVSPDQVTEGDHMTITCDTKLSPHRATTELQFVFYRNGHNVQGFSLSNQYGVPSAQLEDSGNYTCEVQTPTGSMRKRSNVSYIQIQELFSFPQIKVSLHRLVEGDHITMICDTKLSPHRETTELQFAFYRNGHNVQGFSLSNQYGVPSAQLEDSGNYTCEVQTPTGSVRKRSKESHIEIQNGHLAYLVPTLSRMLAVLGIIAIVIFIFKFRSSCCPLHHFKTDHEDILMNIYL